MNAPKKTLHIISHTHWDREWYLPFESFRMKLVELNDNLLDILANDPDFRYFHLDAQTIVLEDYSDVRPDRLHELVNHIKTGRVLVGPWYEQNDEFLTTGESTVRNLLLGSDIARRCGASMPIGYLPDQFGHISQMPQILRGFGLDNAIMGRGRHVKEGDRTEFNWQAPDGSEVFVSYLIHWYNNAQRFPENPEDAVAYLDIATERLAPFCLSSHLLLMNGVDHLEAQENLAPIIAEMQRLRPDVRVIHSTLPDYINAARTELAETDLEVKRGELREGNEYQVLANTASTHVEAKVANIRTGTRLERVVEPFTALERFLGYSRKDIPADYLTHAWKLYMQNHPHDSICCCSHDGVIDDMMNRYQRLDQILDGLQDRFEERYRKLITMEGLKGEDQLLIVFNPNAKPFSGNVCADVDFLADKKVGSFALLSPEGEEIPYIALGREKIAASVYHPINLPGKNNLVRHSIEFPVVNVPPLGYAAYTVKARKKPAKPEAPAETGKSEEPVLENEHLRVAIRENGSLAITHKASGRTWEDCLILEDGGDRGNSYVFNQPENDTLVSTALSRPTLRRVRHDTLGTAWEIRHDLNIPRSLAGKDGQSRGKSTVRCRVTLTVTLLQDARELEVEAHIVNKAKWHRLRALFPTGLGQKEIHVGSAFDIVTRPARRKQEWLAIGNHQEPNLYFTDVNNGSVGFALFNEGLHEYEMLDDEAGTVALTLLRATGIIEGYGNQDAADYKDIHWMFDGLQCLGERTVRFAIHPHSGNTGEADLYNEALRWLTPLITTTRPHDQDDWAAGRPCVQDAPFTAIFQRPEPGDDLPEQPSRLSLVTIDGDGLVLSAVKPALEGDAVIVRVFNPTDDSIRCRVHLAAPVALVEQANLDEQPYARLDAEADHFQDDIPARKIVTWRLSF